MRRSNQWSFGASVIRWTCSKSIWLFVLVAIFCSCSISIAGNDIPAKPDGPTTSLQSVKDEGAFQPHIEPASDEAQRAIDTFAIPQGTKVELVAAEPDLANPVSFCFDEQGRIFVTEAFRIKHGVEDNRSHMDWLDEELAAKTVDDRLAYIKKHLGKGIDDYAQRSDRVQLLEDRDGDGKVDHSTVFAEGFNHILDGNAAGVLANHGDVYLTCIPHLWKLRDENGDGHADHRESLSEGYGVHTTLMGHDMHGLIIGPDGKLYFSIGDRGLNVEVPDTKSLPLPSGDANNRPPLPLGEGRGEGSAGIGIPPHPALSPGERVLSKRLVNIDSGAVLRCNLDGSNLELFATGLRNPQRLAFDDYGNFFSCDNNSDSGDQARWVYIVEGGDSGWRNYYQYVPDRGPFNREQLWRPHFDGQAAYIVPPCGNLADGPSGVVYDPGVSNLPEKYRGCFFLADFRGMASTSGIRAVRIKPKGAGFEVVDNQRFFWSVLATDVQFGPDCQLYVSDWVQGWEGPGKGRIYRLANPAEDVKQAAAMQEVKKLLASDWAKLSTEQLLKLLEHADRRVRQAAQFELASRKATKELTTVALHSQNQLARIHALWAMGQIGLKSWIDAPTLFVLTKLFDDPDAEIRAQAAKILGDMPSVNCDDELIRQLKDKSPRARFFAALALGKRKTPGAFAPLVKLVAENNDHDPFLRHAAIMGLVGCGTGRDLANLSTNESRAVRLAAVVGLRRKQDPIIQTFLHDNDPLVVVEAARAIHDVPIVEALPALAQDTNSDVIHLFPSAPKNSSGNIAAATDGTGDVDAFLRRVLNANYILGDAANALTVASVAEERSDHPQITDALRLEALDMLGHWAKPSSHDRVLNRWRPIEARSDEPAKTAVSDELFPILVATSSLDDAVRGKAIEIVGQLQVQSEQLQLIELASNKMAAAVLRVASLRALERLNYGDLKDLLGTLLTDSQQSVRSESRQLLVKLNPQLALTELRKALETGDLGERQQALAAIIDLNLPAADEILAAAMDQLLADKIPEAMQLDLLEAAEIRGTPKLKEQVARYKNSLPKDDPLAPYRVALYGGDAAAGEKIVRENNELSCRRCHKFGHGSNGVGPELTNIANKLREQFAAEERKPPAEAASAKNTNPLADGKSDEQLERRVREYLLEAVVLPSKTIAKGFETVIVLTDDGKQHSGVLQFEDDKQLRLMTPQGIVETVDKSSIEQRSKGLSAMPADLVNHMTKRQLRDLIAFLANLKGQLAEPELPEGAQAK